MVLSSLPICQEQMKKSLDIHFEKGILTIRGKSKEVELKGYKAVYSEYQSGDYERSFSVPEEIDVEKIEAKVENGVVTIQLPRSPKPEARKIPVKLG